MIDRWLFKDCTTQESPLFYAEETTTRLAAKHRTTIRKLLLGSLLMNYA